jgi:hypothetical protein
MPTSLTLENFVKLSVNLLIGVKTLVEPGSPWENGYIGSFNGKLRDELPNVEIFTTLFEAQVLIENWRKEYNQVRPHSQCDGLLTSCTSDSYAGLRFTMSNSGCGTMTGEHTIVA